jgi:PAS domain S-box-containing protein
VTDLSNYSLESLHKDAGLVLCRGRRKDGPGQVLVSLPEAESPAREVLKRLQSEYRLRAELDSGWAIRPVELVRERGQIALVLEDPGGEPLDQVLERPLELTQFLPLAIGLSAALGALHERGIIHRDIKPANIIVEPRSSQVWLTGFGFALQLARMRQTPEPPETIAGTLAYMAPEQTGRMNRSIDSRSDLYALGVTFYEMLTGRLPFTASDPLGWVHCHIARRPTPLSERRKQLPEALSAIVLKLLAKTAEERYQTAVGAQSDLQRCLDQWESQGRIDEFSLGEHDTPARLLIPEKLYGRGREIDTLLASFDHVVASGSPELVLVSGYSGIGKSSVVNELQKVLVPPRGLFASGKFDQYKRDIPYATLAQAFQSLIRPLLSKSETELRNWRDALQEALGPNGQLIVDLVPELKFILGEQAPVPDLPLQDAQRRFQLVLRRFIGVFARREHPLVLFLDDLQWLDAATLDLLQDLLTSDFATQQSSEPTEAKPPPQTSARPTDADLNNPLPQSRRRLGEVGLRRTGQPDVQHLMLIGAYRDNEVNSAHPVIRKLEAIRQAGAVLQEVILAPLTCKDLGQLIADALHCELERAAPLAQVVYDKTAGNPFFAIQFISALAEEALLTFDHGKGRWSWDLNRIHGKGYTANVVDLMVGRLNRLPLQTQKALQQLACLGNSAKFTTLCIVHETSEDELHSDLWEAVRLEYVVRLGDSYKYVHDRVQEAAYSLIPEQLRAGTHLGIGRLLTAHTPPEKREEAIFEIVNQLNRGVALITSREERDKTAELNLVAGRRAKASTAYASALRYFCAGAALLADDCWERQHELIFALELHRSECEFLTGQLPAAAERLAILSSRAANTVELAMVAGLRVEVHTTLDQIDYAVAVCLDYLRQLGIEWSPHPTEEEARREYDWIRSQLGSRTIEELIKLPLMSDSLSIATMDVLNKVMPGAFFTDPQLLFLVVCRMINLSLEHGNHDHSCVAYAALGGIAGPRFGDYKSGFRFGRLGYELVEQRELKGFQARTYVIFGAQVMPWTRHVQAARELLRRAFEAANKIGDLTYAAYSLLDLNTILLATGDSLVEVQREAEHGLEFAQKARFGLSIDLITPQLGLIRTLRGLTPKFGCFDDGEFDELRFEGHLSSNPSLAQPECFYWIRKLQARFFAGDYASAIDASSRAQRLLWVSSPFFETAEYQFYAALCRAASYNSAAADQRQQHFEALVAHHRQLEVWAENCPENFEDRAALVSAEIARIEGCTLDAESLYEQAMRLYEQAVRSAHANGFVHNEALANELAARFYAARGLTKIAHAHLRDARYCYLRWGAFGKVRQLDRLYPGLEDQEPLGPTIAMGASIEQLDLATVVKTMQAASREIDLGRLIEAVMVVAVECAGAERGLLFLGRGIKPGIVAEALTRDDKIQVILEQGLITPEFPESILRYVIRTRQSVILADASVKNSFSDDKYLQSVSVRSILCLPLIKQGILIGELYLENNQVAGVFNRDRLTVLELLTSQAAISLENARLYSELWEENSQRTKAEEALRASEERMNLAAEAANLGMWAWELANDDLWATAKCRTLFGFEPGERVDFRRFMDRVHSEDRKPILEALRRSLESRSEYAVEYRLAMPDGTTRWISTRGHPTFDASNKAVRVMGVSMDITAAKLAQLQLLQQRDELAHLSRLTTIGELATTLAHELNQPIGAMHTNAEAAEILLQNDVPDLDEVRAIVSDIRRDGWRAGEVIHRMRSLLRKREFRAERVNVKGLVEAVSELLHGTLMSHKVRLRIEVTRGLPLVLGDPIHLQQVLLNLILNAVEAMIDCPPGEREVVVRATTAALGVEVTVTDQGPGFPKWKLARLFEPFLSTKKNGMGMGLAICQTIIQAHGGHITGENNPGRGATVRFTLRASNPREEKSE